MGIKLLIVLMTAVLMLAGCQLIRIDRASFSPSTPLRFNADSSYAFNPEGKETFLLKELPKAIQRNGYQNFCANTNTPRCNNPLPYLRYLGVKGYFDSVLPIKTDYKNYEYYPVILETGERFFFLSLRKEAGKYGEKSPIAPLYGVALKAQQPIVENSKITILGEYHSFNKTYYRLSNDSVLESRQLEHIRNLSANHLHRTEIVELLLGVSIEYNDDYDSYLIQPHQSVFSSDIRLIIGINASSHWLRLKVSHLGERVMSINSYAVIADEMKWRSPTLRFAVLSTTVKVAESFEITANDHEIKMVTALAGASRAMLRLYGAHKSVFQLLKAPQKKQLYDMLKLSQLLRPINL